MKASELRIGNFVQHKCGAHYKISAYDIVDVADGTFNIDPIPLTEEWLLRLGFEENKKYYGFAIKINMSGYNSFLVITKTSYYIAHERPAGMTIQLNDIKYVHQLQNLYFALTGEELTIKK